MTIPVDKSIKNVDIVDSIRSWNLNFTDIVNNNNKAYYIEIIKDRNGKFYLYSSYGRTGAKGVTEYRVCDSEAQAEKEATAIVKSNIKKGYVEIALIKQDVGSEIAKSKVNASVITEESAKKLGYSIKEETKSTLHPEIQAVVKNWFGSMEQFVVDTLDTSKCALGQLSLDQINKGRDLLLEARGLVNAGAKDITELNSISSKYYSNIPMNFGYKRLNIEQLRFDNHDKLDKAFEILDTLENVKESEKVLTKKSLIDDQYKSLKTGMEWVDPQDATFKWIDLMFHKTRASNHSGLGKLRVSNVFKLIRDNEYNEYINQAELIAKNKVNQIIPDNYRSSWEIRPKDNSDYEKLMKSANIIPLYHGTLTANLKKILSDKMRFRKPGFTVSGSMFDRFGALYFANSSTKSCGYSSLRNSAWSKGNDSKAYLFLSDVCLGNSEVAHYAHPYTLDGIKPNMSVWAKAGKSLYNDEYMVYQDNQNWLRYIIEIESIK